VRLARTTAPTAAPADLAWTFDEFVLDPTTYELRRNGQAVPLEPQVFDVLLRLVTHHDRVVGREELMDAVWGAGYGSDASLSTRIKEARRGLGDDGRSQTYIRTVRGRGYRFVRVPTTEPRSSTLCTRHCRCRG